MERIGMAGIYTDHGGAKHYAIILSDAEPPLVKVFMQNGREESFHAGIGSGPGQMEPTVQTTSAEIDGLILVRMRGLLLELAGRAEIRFNEEETLQVPHIVESIMRHLVVLGLQQMGLNRVSQLRSDMEQDLQAVIDARVQKLMEDLRDKYGNGREDTDKRFAELADALNRIMEIIKPPEPVKSVKPPSGSKPKPVSFGNIGDPIPDAEGKKEGG